MIEAVCCLTIKWRDSFLLVWFRENFVKSGFTKKNVSKLFPVWILVVMTQTFLACPACMMTMRAIPIVMLSVTLIPTYTPCGCTHSQFPSSTWGGGGAFGGCLLSCVPSEPLCTPFESNSLPLPWLLAPSALGATSILPTTVKISAQIILGDLGWSHPQGHQIFCVPWSLHFSKVTLLCAKESLLLS